MSRIPFFVLLTACNTVYLAPDASAPAGARAASGECRAIGGTFSGVAFTDEEAHNAVDFADNASVAELEAMLGIGPSIANRIVEARPFGTQPDPMAALDRVAYVGPVLLERFRTDTWALWCSLDDGRQGCCVDLACEGLGGAPSGVTFDDAEAEMVLDWANRASFDELDAVCGVGPSIAGDIVAARPLHTLAALDAVPYVGPTALHRLLGDEGYACATRPSVAELWCATDGACTCDTGTPDAPTGVVEVIPHEGPWTTPDEVQAAIDELLAKTDWCDPEWPGTTQLSGLFEHRVDGATTGWTVELVQWAPDFEFGWAITVDLDADGALLGEACMAL